MALLPLLILYSLFSYLLLVTFVLLASVSELIYIHDFNCPYWWLGHQGPCFSFVCACIYACHYELNPSPLPLHWLFYANLTQARVMGRGTLSWGNVPTRCTCGQDHDAFSWLEVGVCGPSPLCLVSPWTDATEYSKTAGWASREQKANTGRWPLSQFLTQGSHLAWVSSLTSLQDGL